MTDLLPYVTYADRTDINGRLVIDVQQGDRPLKTVVIHRADACYMPGYRLYIAVCDRFGCGQEERFETRDGVTEGDVVSGAALWAVTHFCGNES